MAFPTSESELQAQGYRYKNKGLCRGCEATILWYETPNKKSMPLDPGTLVPHWSTCVQADRFRKKKV